MQVSSNFSSNANVYNRPQQKNKSIGFGAPQITREMCKGPIKTAFEKYEAAPNEGIGFIISQNIKNFLKSPSVDQLVSQIQEAYIRAHNAKSLFMEKVFFIHTEMLISKATKKQQKLGLMTKQEAAEIINKKAGL